MKTFYAPTIDGVRFMQTHPRNVGVMSLFDPSEIASHNFQWDFSDASTITLNGSNISAISDKSVSSFDLEQTTAADQPELITAGQDGSDIARFDGATEYLTRTASGPVLTTCTLFLTMAIIVHSDSDGVIAFAPTGGGDHNTEDGFQFSHSNGVGDLIFFGRAVGSNAIGMKTSAIDTSWHLIEVHVDGSGGAEIFVDSTSEDTDTYDNLEPIEPSRIALPGRYNSGGGPSNFAEQDMGEINGFTADLSGNDLTNMRNYKTDKWGTP